MTVLIPLTSAVYRVLSKCIFHDFLRRPLFSTPKMTSQQDDQELSARCRQLAPPLANNRHKGQAGTVGVFGGCLEYTGAPYFASIASLKVGADLVRVFCMKAAAPVIKSYSPELMVHPYLDEERALELIEPWLDRLQVVLVGPGLGRDERTLGTIGEIIKKCKEKGKPLVVDADGLFYLSRNPEALVDYPSPGVILTPNKREFANLLHLDAAEEPKEKLSAFLKLAKNAMILCKGQEDEITNGEKTLKVSGGGSGRRCGGQGDVLAGSLTTFYAWALQGDVPDGALIAGYAACRLVRECNARAFRKKGRSMLASDMIEEIHPVFEDLFELRP